MRCYTCYHGYVIAGDKQPDCSGGYKQNEDCKYYVVRAECPLGYVFKQTVDCKNCRDQQHCNDHFLDVRKMIKIWRKCNVCGEYLMTAACQGSAAQRTGQYKFINAGVIFKGETVMANENLHK